jgi:hypothetical protein
MPAQTDATVKFATINDYGAVVPGTAKVTVAAKVIATASDD